MFGRRPSAIGMVGVMADIQTWIASVSLVSPLPAGAVVAALPASVIKRRFITGLAGTALAGAGWFLNPIVGLIGLSAGMFVATNRHSRRGKRLAVWAAVIPPIAALGAYMWAKPESGIAMPVRHPIPFAAALIVLTAIGVYVAYRLRPELDPQRTFTAAQRAEVIARDGNRCGYCGVAGDALGVRLEMDHVIAHSKGGRSDTSNAILACGPCNGLKSAHTYEDFGELFEEVHGFKPGEYDKPGFWDRVFGA